jgi:cytochrome o ubiquinol oxidase subunit 3
MSASDTAMRSAFVDPHRVGHHGDEAAGHGAGGPASKRVIVAYGFWLFLLSDIVVFSAFFATYAVLRNSTADGPGPRQLFDVNKVAVETACLLASSFVCGLASIAASVRSMRWTQICLLFTGILGFAFVVLEFQ